MLRKPKVTKKEKKLLKKNAKLNKSLLTVPLSTQNSMGIISVDREGIFRLKEDRWIKVYVMEETIPYEDREYILSNMNARLRETLISDGSEKRLFLSISCIAPDYVSARDIIKKQESLICEKIKLYPLDIQRTLESIHDNYLFAGIKDFRFNLSSDLKGKKKDWKNSCFLKGEAKDTYIKYKDSHVSGFFSLQLPHSFNPDTLKAIFNFGYPFVIVSDYESMSLSEYRMFNKLLEQRYNRKIMDDKNSVFNFSIQIAMFSDSKEARKIIESSILNYMAKNGVVMSPSFEYGEEQFFSMNSFGIVDFKNPRSISKSILVNFMI